MPIIQIRDVPEDVKDELVRRARESQQSLQQYTRNLLIAQTRKPDSALIWERAAVRAREAESSYPLSDAVDDVRRMRGEREA